MLTVHATLLPNGQVQLPPGLARPRPIPVLVTILEPIPEQEQAVAALAGIEQGSGVGPAGPAPVALPQPLSAIGKGSIASLLALLASPEFLALPKADDQEVEERIQSLRNDWDER